MRIYVASSWRNERRHQAVVGVLRHDGHDVYDFRNPKPGDEGFSWWQCARQEQLEDPVRFRDEVLTHPVARAGFESDMGALRAADCTILVLPCGRSAHLELGYAVGARQLTAVLLDEPLSKPELMYLMVDRICTTMGEVTRFIEGSEAAYEATACAGCGRRGTTHEGRIPSGLVALHWRVNNAWVCIECAHKRGLVSL